MGGNELERVALALEFGCRPHTYRGETYCDEHGADMVTDEICEHATAKARAAIAAMTPTPQVVDSTCTCPSGDGSLRWPCPQHPPTPDVGVLAEVRAWLARWDYAIPTYTSGELRKILDPHPTLDVDVLAEERCNCGFGGVHEPLNKRCALNGHDVLAEVRAYAESLVFKGRGEPDEGASAADHIAGELLAILNGEPTSDAPCPTCAFPRRETVGLVCQTCGRDYGATSEVLADVGAHAGQLGVAAENTAEFTCAVAKFSALESVLDEVRALIRHQREFNHNDCIDAELLESTLNKYEAGR